MQVLALQEHSLPLLATSPDLVRRGRPDGCVDGQVGDLLERLGPNVAAAPVLGLAGSALPGLLAGRPLAGELDLANGEQVLRVRRGFGPPGAAAGHPLVGALGLLACVRLGGVGLGLGFLPGL